MENVNSSGSIRRVGSYIFAVVPAAGGERMAKVGRVVLGQYVPLAPADWAGTKVELASLWADAQAALTAGRLKGMFGLIKRAF